VRRENVGSNGCPRHSGGWTGQCTVGPLCGEIVPDEIRSAEQRILTTTPAAFAGLCRTGFRDPRTLSAYRSRQRHSAAARRDGRADLGKFCGRRRLSPFLAYADLNRVRYSGLFAIAAFLDQRRVDDGVL